MTQRQNTIDYHNAVVERVISYMRAVPGDELTTLDMARMANMSRFHFLRSFAKATGITPSRFLAALRIGRAKEFLLITSLSVSSIAFEVGYNSVGTFTRLFTEFVGLSPRMFRRLAALIKADPGLMESHMGQYFASPLGGDSQKTVRGSVTEPPDFHGVVFVGLFPTPIPQRKPLAGQLLSRHIFELPLPQGKAPVYCLAAALPYPLDVASLLCPERSELLVGSAVIPQDAEPRDLTIDLRPLGILDPPLLVALPVLLGFGQQTEVSKFMHIPVTAHKECDYS